GGHGGIGTQCLAHLARANFGRRPRLVATLLFFIATLLEFFIAHAHVDAAVRDVDVDGVAFAHQTNRATFSCFWRSVTDGKTTGAAGETTVGQQRTGFAET